MSALSTEQPIATTINRPAPRYRPPVWQDYLFYFLGIPVTLAVIFSLVGTRLTNGLPYIDALYYMLLHMFTAWWSVNLGGLIIKYSFRSWQPPTLSVCLLGLLIALIPAAVLFQILGDYYASNHPVFAANREDQILPGWDVDYLLHFIRYSFPVLPTFLAGAYGYRYVTGVNWFGYPPSEEVAGQQDSRSAADKPVLKQALAGRIEGSKLPADAKILAIKAEQHYIQIWSDQGNDLVRYRFSDVPKTFADCRGAQVHRSWWVNLDYVQTYNTNGRKMVLNINDQLSIPVSLSFKNAVLEKLK